MKTKPFGGLINLIFVMLFVGATIQTASPQAKPSKPSSKPSIETNVKSALELMGDHIRNSVTTVLVRRSVIVGVPTPLSNGKFDTALRDLIEHDQTLKRKHWKKSPKILSWIFKDGQRPYREKVPAGGLEVDIYEPADRDLPDYIKTLVIHDQALAKTDPSYTAPPFYYKMDVDESYGVKETFRALGHLIFRQNTDPTRIAVLLERRRLGQAQALAETEQ